MLREPRRDDYTIWTATAPEAVLTVRTFIMVTWMVQKAGEKPETEAEARKRVDALRTGASRRDWLPF